MVLLNRLLEVGDAFPLIKFAIASIVTLEVAFVRLRVDGASARQVDSLRWRELRFDLIRDGVVSLEGRSPASAIAFASTKSFLLVFTNGFTCYAGIGRTS